MLTTYMTSINYVAFEPVQIKPGLHYLNERHITGIATKRNGPPGALGPNIILDGSRPGGETSSVPELFQSTSHALRFATCPRGGPKFSHTAVTGRPNACIKKMRIPECQHQWSAFIQWAGIYPESRAG